MVGGSPHRNPASTIEGELLGLDEELCRLGLPRAIFRRPKPRRITTSGSLTSPWNSEILRVLEALVRHLTRRMEAAPRDVGVLKIRVRVDEIAARLLRERERQRPV